MKKSKEEKIIMLGGEKFTLKKAILKSDISNYYTNNKYSLDQCYNRPSEAKRNIFNYWHDIALNNDCSTLKVKGYNSMMLTLETMKLIDNKVYYFYITKTKQEVREVIY